MRMSRKIFITGISLILAGAFLLSLFSGHARNAHAAGKEVKVGVIVPITGPGAPFGKRSWNTYQMVFDEVNEKGGIKSLGGAKVKYQVYDTETKAEVATAQAEKAIYEGAILLAGANQTEAALAAAQVGERHQVPVIAHFDAAPILTEKGLKFVFRVNARMDVYAKQAMEVVEWITKKVNKPVKQVGILYVDQAALATAGKICHDWAIKKGVKIVYEDVYPMGTTEFSSIMTRIKAAKPDMLFVTSYTPDAIGITRAMKEMDVNVDGLVSAIGGHYTLDYMKTLGADSNYTINAGVYAPDLRVSNLPGIQERYKKRFGYDLDGTDAVTFDAAQVIISALERAGSTDGVKLRDVLRATEIKVGTGYYILPDGCKFDAVGENIWQKAVAFQIQNQKWVSIYPENYAGGKPIWPRPKWSESK